MVPLVEITEVSKQYDNGEMDIKTKGVKIFRILEIITELPEKLYNGAIVNYPDNYEKGIPGTMKKIMKSHQGAASTIKAGQGF